MAIIPTTLSQQNLTFEWLFFFSVESVKHVPAIRQVWNNNIIFLLILRAIDNSNKFLIVKYTVKGPYS